MCFISASGLTSKFFPKNLLKENHFRSKISDFGGRQGFTSEPLEELEMKKLTARPTSKVFRNFLFLPLTLLICLSFSTVAFAEGGDGKFEVEPDDGLNTWLNEVCLDLELPSFSISAKFDEIELELLDLQGLLDWLGLSFGDPTDLLNCLPDQIPNLDILQLGDLSQCLTGKLPEFPDLTQCLPDFDPGSMFNDLASCIDDNIDLNLPDINPDSFIGCIGDGVGNLVDFTGDLPDVLEIVNWIEDFVTEIFELIDFLDAAITGDFDLAINWLFDFCGQYTSAGDILGDSCDENADERKRCEKKCDRKCWKKNPSSVKEFRRCTRKCVKKCMN